MRLLLFFAFVCFGKVDGLDRAPDGKDHLGEGKDGEYPESLRPIGGKEDQREIEGDCREIDEERKGKLFFVFGGKGVGTVGDKGVIVLTDDEKIAFMLKDTGRDAVDDHETHDARGGKGIGGDCGVGAKDKADGEIQRQKGGEQNGDDAFFHGWSPAFEELVGRD